MKAFDQAWDFLKGYEDLRDMGARLVLMGKDLERDDPDWRDDEDYLKYLTGEFSPGHERLQYNIEIPKSTALELLGEPDFDYKPRVTRGNPGAKMSRALNNVLMAMGYRPRNDGRRPDHPDNLDDNLADPIFGRGQFGRIPMYPSTIGSRLGGDTPLPHSRSEQSYGGTRLSPKEVYLDYSRRMQPFVHNAVRRTGGDMIPVAGTMMHSLARGVPSVGLIPGFEGHQFGLASKLGLLQDIGAIDSNATTSGQLMNREIGKIPGITRRTGLWGGNTVGGGSSSIIMDEPRELLDLPKARNTGIADAARVVGSNLDFFPKEKRPYMEGFSRRWR